MKTKKRKTTELDVDCIGQQIPLTSEQEKAISDFIQQHKKKNGVKFPKNKRKQDKISIKN